tara:strand:+ start:457 stop:690 length:234 start_codon:yes stop_codon:yes gene_type:complete
MTNSDIQDKPIKIWDVISGPYPFDHPDLDDVHYNLCKIEVDGKIDSMEYFFDTFNDAYEMVKYFQKNIDPIEIKIED